MCPETMRQTFLYHHAAQVAKGLAIVLLGRLRSRFKLRHRNFLEDEMRNLMSMLVVASSLVVGIAAQGQQSPGQEPSTREQPPSTPREQPVVGGEQSAPRPQQQATAQVTKVTISGCIQNAPPAAPPTAGAASTPAASKFDLANAKMVSGAPVGTTGAAAGGHPISTRGR